MATYFTPPLKNNSGTEVGPVEVQYEWDDAGTPAAVPEIDDDPALLDDTIINVWWRNPNPRDASMVITSTRSGQVRTFILAANTPDWQTVAVPNSLQARRGSLRISGPNYPATVGGSRR